MRSAFRFQKEREETNQTDGNKKNLAIFEDEKPSREWQIHFLKKRTEDPEGSPLSFSCPHNIYCEQVFRVFSDSTRVHTINTKDAEDRSSGRKTIL